MSSDVKKIAISFAMLAVGFTCVYLLGKYPINHNVGDPKTFTVLDHTLTQSLDGHRAYLTISIAPQDKSVAAQESARVSIDPTIVCQPGDIVTLQPVRAILSNVVSYRVISCERSSK